MVLSPSNLLNSTNADSFRSDKRLAYRGFKIPRSTTCSIYLTILPCSDKVALNRSFITYRDSVRGGIVQCKEALVVYLNTVCLGHALFSTR